MQRLFQKITTLPPSENKQHAIHSAIMSCTALVMQKPSYIDQIPLELCLHLVQENIDDAQNTQLTVEAALLQQLNAKTLLGAVALLCFIHFGLNPRELSQGKPFGHSVSRSPNSTQQARVVEKLVFLLRTFRAWATRHLRRYPLATNLSTMDFSEQSDFLRLRDELAERMGEFTFNSSDVHAIISEIRGLRAIAQVTDLHRRSKALDPIRNNSASSRVESFLIAFTNQSSSAIGRVMVEHDAVRFWTMKEWSTQLHRFPAFQPQLDSEAKRLELDQWCDLIVSDQFLINSPNTAGSCSTDDSASSPPTSNHKSYFVACADFTGLALPCAILQIPDSSRPWYIHTGSWMSSAQSSTPRIMYCGRIRYSPNSLLTYDDNKRAVLDSQSQETILKYSEFGSSAQVKRFARELPYASYERWLLQDLAQAHGHELDLLCDENAIRPRFLSLIPADYRVVHISTHGEGDETIPECSRLEMACLPGKANVVSFIDIQSMNWSKTDLVFLNACHSAVGRRSSGEGALSLAWAFSAGGAKAVIAARWSIDDDAAWYFAKCFYESWQFSSEDWSIVRAFHDALEKTRTHDSFSRPSIWGAFTLLHAGEILPSPS